MSEEKSTSKPAPEAAPEYQTPAIEEVVTREGLEREVAYAGVIGPSDLAN